MVSIEKDHGLLSLPSDIFLFILEKLDSADLIRCRSVSKLWFDVFTRSNNLCFYLRSIYPLAREVKELDRYDYDGFTENVTNYKIRKAFDRVTSRYFHLARAKPQSIQRFPISSPLMDDKGILPIESWTSHESHPYGHIDHKFLPSFWTYDDGVLVMWTQEEFLLLLDLEAKKTNVVPFSTSGRTIRNIRLKDRLLVIEWSDFVSSLIYRHFTSIYDVNSSSVAITATIRNEWHILNSTGPFVKQTRFYSSHNRNYYVLYSWQPNRSVITLLDDAPIEYLTVWDISSSSQPIALSNGGHSVRNRNGAPVMVTLFDFHKLDFYSIRQRGAPSMIKLGIDSEAGVVDFIENKVNLGTRLASTDMVFRTITRITSIPFISQGPCWRRDSDALYPPYRGNWSLHNQALPANEKMPYMHLSEVVDESSRVRFSLQSKSPDNIASSRHLQILINTPQSSALMDTKLSTDIGCMGKISGDERFLIGEDINTELVIYYFD